MNKSKHIVVLENKELPFSDQALLKSLQGHDKPSQKDGKTIFDWSKPGKPKATSYVGIFQIPGLTVEILPKICENKNSEEEKIASRASLLFMLSYIKRIPLEYRNNATLRLEKMPLFEALIAIFAEMLHTEFRRGIDHAYYYREENLNRFKGKLLVNEHIRKNAAHQERVYVGFDEFVSDTWLNRIIKKCCRILVSMVTSQENEKSLRKALLILDEVSDRTITMHDLDRITLNRNTERFSEILKFCCMIIGQRTPGFSQSRNNTFSLLFPMEVVFEEFVAEVMRRHPEFNGYNVYSQDEKPFATSAKDNFTIRPDVILKKKGNTNYSLILDTKWKCLEKDKKHFGIEQDDMFQIYVYSSILDCPKSLLLYPESGEKIDNIIYNFYDKKHQVKIATISMNLTKEAHVEYVAKEPLDIFAEKLKLIIE